MTTLERLIMLERARQELYSDASIPHWIRKARIEALTKEIRGAQDEWNRERARMFADIDPTRGVPSLCFGSGVPTQPKQNEWVDRNRKKKWK